MKQESIKVNQTDQTKICCYEVTTNRNEVTVDNDNIDKLKINRLKVIKEDQLH